MKVMGYEGLRSRMMNADDGDTVSIRGIWTEEANKEAEELMKKKTAHLTISGGNCRVVSNEVLTSFYLLTKDGNGKFIGSILNDEYLSMQPDEFTKSKIIRMFADTGSADDKKHAIHKSLHNPFDKIKVPKDFFYKGSSEMNMNLGRFLFNHFVLNGADIIEISGICNDVLDKKGLERLDNLIGKLFLESKITSDQFASYIDRRDTLGYWLISILNTSISLKMAQPLKEIEKMKAELIEKNKEKLDDHDIDTMNMIETKLVDKAKELLKDDSGMEQYNSGELNFSNNYKCNAIMKGPVKNKLLDRFDFVDSSYMDGMEIKDLDIHANSILAGQYPASIGTKKAGYLGKKLMALLQMVELDEKGTDCGTKRLIPITITEKNKSGLLYSYIQDGNNLIMLDDKNIKDYIGKRMLFRSPMSCIGEKLCNKCAGELLYMLGAKEAGLWSVQLSHSMLNLALKAKHDISVNLYHIDPNKVEEVI